MPLTPVSPLSLLAGLVTAMVIGLVVAIPLTIWATSPGTDDEAEAKPPPTEHRGVKIQRTMKAPQEKSKQEILDERLRELEEREALEAEAEAEAAQPGSGDDPGAPATETPAEGSAEDGPSLSEQLGD